MQFYLLTHAREYARKSNTGQIAANCLSKLVTRIAWDRVNPNQQLVRLIQDNNIVLLHPQGEPFQAPVEPNSNFLIIDSTWQEARKIYNRSPYLNHVAKSSLIPTHQSSYSLRRNQPIGGLCTAECIIELLLLHGEVDSAETLKLQYEQFNQKTT